MGFLLLLILIVVVIAVAASSGSGKSRYAGSYHGGYVRDYDEEAYEDYETRAAMGERGYFTDDPARDYDSYYAQVADAADMGDQEAIDEMYGEFGEGEW